MNKARNIYYSILIGILVVTGCIYTAVDPIFPIEKMVLLCTALGLICQGLYFHFSKCNYLESGRWAFIQVTILLLLVMICHKSIPHYLIHQGIDVYYKLVGVLMLVPAVYLFYRGMQGDEKLSWIATAKQIVLWASIVAVSYAVTFGVFDEQFDLKTAEQYFEVQEEAGFEMSSNLAYVENGKVYFNEPIGNLSEEVESWENIAFASCGETHILGLSVDGKVFAAGEGFFGQTDVSGMKNIEFVYAGDEKSYLITADGGLFVVGLDCDEQDYEKLELLRKIVKLQ